VSAALGARGTLVAAGALGAAVTLAGLLLPGVRALGSRSPAQLAAAVD
jgi:hypothetical protein